MNFFYAVNAAHAAATSSGIVTSGLIWHIDPTNSSSYPGSGSTIYDLIGSNNGTFEGGTYVDGNGYLVLDGVNDNVNFGTIATGNAMAIGPNSFTIQGWGYNIGTGETFQQLYSAYGAGDIDRVLLQRTTADNRYRCVLFSGSTNQQTPNLGANSNDNTWYFATFIYDASTATIELYLNTTASGTTSSIIAPNLVSRTLRVGAKSTAPSTLEWNGKIGAVMQYNRALSATEITQNFNATKANYGL